MARNRPPGRIFLGPIEIAGVFNGLEAGFRELGLTARFVDVSGDPFRYRGSGLARLLSGPTTGIGERRDGQTSRNLRRVARALARVVVFVVACTRYDIFILGGTGFFYGWELPLLRLLGKKVVWMFLGSDHRPPYLSGRYVRGVEALDLAALARETQRIARRVRRVESGADAIVAHEASAQFHRRRYVRLLSIGLPTPARPSLPVGDTGSGNRAAESVRILHCPTDPYAKGSSIIRRHIDDLVEAGLPITYRELVGRPHSEVLAALNEVDLVIDEVYGDTPMAMLGAEAAAAGVGTVCGGYFATIIRSLVPEEAIPPTAYVEPDAMGATLERLIRDPSARVDLGAAAHAFVTEAWRPASVAGRLLKVLANEAPDEWNVAPGDISYIDGYGISRSLRLQATSELVKAYGTKALALDHRPDLREKLLTEAGER